MSKTLFGPVLLISGILMSVAPVLIARAPYESTMGLVQKIFYFHAPSAMVMFLSTIICGVASGIYLFTGRKNADHLATSAAELTVIFGLIVLLTGPLWARKAWGVWWQWDARLTTTLLLWLIFVAYLLLRRYGGPGADKLAAALGVFGMADVPLVYVSVSVWRTVHPKTTVVPSLGPGMRETFWLCAFALLGVYLLLLAARTRLEQHRTMLNQLHAEVDT